MDTGSLTVGGRGGSACALYRAWRGALVSGQIRGGMFGDGRDAGWIWDDPLPAHAARNQSCSGGPRASPPHESPLGRSTGREQSHTMGRSHIAALAGADVARGRFLISNAVPGILDGGWTITQDRGLRRVT